MVKLCSFDARSEGQLGYSLQEQEIDWAIRRADRWIDCQDSQPILDGEQDERLNECWIFT